MQHEHHRVPVTALAIWKQDVLLVGSGSYLKLYDTKTEKLLDSIQVFDKQQIHGILVNNDNLGQVLVWGGHYLRQLRFTPCPHDFTDKSTLRGLIRLSSDDSWRHVDKPDYSSLTYKSSKIAKCKDWILDTAVSHGNGRRVAIITAHNALIIATPKPKSLDYNLAEAVPGSNCILYCAQATWLSESQCLIASGTAFGDIIIWSWNYSQDDLQWHKQQHYNFAAHDGSVFGLQISTPEFKDTFGGRQMVLASCSDDRTVRLWDISDLTIRDSDVAQRRETGFGSALSEDDQKPTCLVKQLGHISRIWHIRYVRNSSNDYLLSFGEDATCITWAIRTAATSSLSLEQVHMQRAHDGKNIWSVGVNFGLGYAANDPRGSPGSYIATGGADGAIAMTRIDSYDQSSREPQDSTISYRAYGFISSDKIIAVTDIGGVELLTLNTLQGTMENEVLSPPVLGLRGYSTMATAANLAFFAGKGQVHYFTLRDHMHDVLIDVDGKVASLFAQDIPDTQDRQGQCSLFVTTVKADTATWYLCQRASGFGIDIAETCTIELPAKFVVTSFVEIEHDERPWIVLGSRTGGVAIYALPPRKGDTKPLRHLTLCPGVHGKEAVTALSYTSDTLFSTGRDGTYAAHKIDFAGLLSNIAFRPGLLSNTTSHHKIGIRTIHQLLLPVGPNIEAMNRNERGNIWVCGFRGKQFIVFDIHTQCEVMVIECGGAHRNFAFQPGPNGGTFVWTKTSELYYQHQNQLPYRLLNSGGHGREIKATAVSPINSSLVATGAEDTNIKLHILEDGGWRCLHTLQKHITGIQHLQWSEDGNYLFSSGGVEEFYVWHISLDVPTELGGIGVVCESTHPDSTTSDLRIMSFDVEPSGPFFDITMVYSNSAVRKWHYENKGWKMVAGGNYLTSCLTQCHHLSADETLITASTDGHLVSWKQGPLRWHARHQVHQNSILSLLSHRLSSGRHLLISGGDDNALGLTLSAATSNTYPLLPSSFSTLLVPNAHAAAITALVIIKYEVQDSKGTLWLVSGSIDQRIKLWKINSDNDKEGVDALEIELVRNVHTAVADVASLELVGGDKDKVLVCGVGMDIWRVDWAK